INKRVLTAVLARGMKAYRMIKPLMQVQRKWLEKALLSIDNEWGDFQSYLRDGLELRQTDIQQLRDTLIE
ncbi:MAG: tyrosine-protein phosphatase, partial [Anaerolineales bacterium]|nr:tyrosine-protein phosphatase [Anaerolineales bacterium]